MSPNADVLKVLPTLALYATLIVLIVTSGVAFVGYIAFRKTETGGAKTFSLLLERSNALQMLTVILIVLAACMLRLIDMINSEAVITLLSGVAGYVLGGARREKDVSD
jgi:hypothetical protein